MTALLFNHLWQSTLCAGVIAILALALRHHRARLRYGLWLAASVKFLVPFATLAAAGGLLEWQQAPAPIRSVVASPGLRDFNAPFAAMWSDPTPMVAAAAQPRWIALLFFTAWACGFTAIVLRRVRQWREVRAAVRASTLFAAAPPVPAGIEIRTAPTVLEPGVVGFRRPVILLPEGIDAYLTTDQLAAVLAHEVCHARRRDNLTAAMHMLVEAVFWFHPLVWVIGARLVATREQACDEHVVAETAAPIAYAEGIVSVCRRYIETPHMAVAGVGGADIKARIDAILANRIGLRLTLSKRLVLAAVGMLSLTVPIVTGAIDAAALADGQLPGAPAGGPPIDPQLRFEVASIKPYASKAGDPIRVMTRFMPGGGFDAVNVTLGSVIRLAYGLQDFQLAGAPEWVNSDRFDIQARGPQGAVESEVPRRLQSLLTERLSLKAHKETRDHPIFALVLARDDKSLGPRLRRSQVDREKVREAMAAARRENRRPPLVECGLTANRTFGFCGMTIEELAGFLPEFAGRMVVDRTGLTGAFDLEFRFDASRPIPGAGAGGGFPLGPQPAGPVDPDTPSIFTALQEQLGLKLEAQTGPIEVLVIDHVGHPEPN